mgnify:CR=1 FL=1
MKSDNFPAKKKAPADVNRRRLRRNGEPSSDEKEHQYDLPRNDAQEHRQGVDRRVRNDGEPLFGEAVDERQRRRTRGGTGDKPDDRVEVKLHVASGHHAHHKHRDRGDQKTDPHVEPTDAVEECVKKEASRA